jgi:ubiquitin C-terminal hydrolase
VRVLSAPEEAVALFRDEASPGAVTAGLTNAGNTCFLNAVLNCLTFTQPLHALALRRAHSRSCALAQRGAPCALCLLEAHVNEYAAAKGEVLPLALLRNLPRLNQQFALGQQEDAHELLRSLLRGMQHACLAGVAAAERLDPASLATTLVDQMFSGSLESRLLCTSCGHTSNSFEPFLDLSLEVGEHVDSLPEALEAFCAPERLDEANACRCGGCGERVRAVKRLAICRMPNVLCLQLKRFRAGFFGKVNREVAFPPELNLAPMRSPLSPDAPESCRFRLYAVLVHLDAFNISAFGHYICFVRDGKGHWWRMDDARVERLPFAEVAKQKNAYMFFYQRTQPDVAWFSPPPPDAAAPAEATAPAPAAAPPAPSPSPSPPPGEAPAPAQAAAPALCSNGCGFFGSERTRGMCSRCFAQKFPAEAAALQPAKPARAASAAPDPRVAQLAAIRAAGGAEQWLAQQLAEQQRAAQQERAQTDAMLAAVAAQQQQQQQQQPQGSWKKPKVGPEKVSRNDPCPCGSNLKYKKCHGKGVA